MDVIRVCGGHPITGEVTVEGAKNSALKLMAATVMAPGVTTLTNVPDIADVHVMGKVLKRLGAHIDVAGKHELGTQWVGTVLEKFRDDAHHVLAACIARRLRRNVHQSGIHAAIDE